MASPRKTAPKANDLCATVVTTIASGDVAIRSANQSLLDNLVTLLADEAPVTEKVWQDHWHERAFDLLLASGAYALDKDKDGKPIEGKSLSAQAARSNMKVAVLGLTNGYEPDGERSLKDYVQAVRGMLKDDGIIAETKEARDARKAKEALRNAPKAKGAKTLAGQAADAVEAAAKASSGAGALLAAAMILTGKNAQRAKNLVAIITSHAEAFDVFAAETLAAPLAPASRRKGR